MSKKTPIILIHGTWCTTKIWEDFKPALELLGFEVYTPHLRYHDLAFDEAEKSIGNISLNDYVSDLEKLLLSLKSPPIILGHSLGGLIAQKLASRHPTKHIGLILLSPAPMAGIFSLYPTMFSAFYRHYLQWKFWNKPVLPNKETCVKYIMNNQSEENQDQLYNTLVPESGRAYAEIALWFLDPNKASKVSTKNINGPVLLITGSEDKVVVPNISYATAKKYKNSKLVEIQGSDHIYQKGQSMPHTIKEIQLWFKENY